MALPGGSVKASARSAIRRTDRSPNFTNRSAASADSQIGTKNDQFGGLAAENEMRTSWRQRILFFGFVVFWYEYRLKKSHLCPR
jgi:hypothetical protein